MTTIYAGKLSLRVSCRSQARIKEKGLAWGKRLHLEKRASYGNGRMRDNTALGDMGEVHTAGLMKDGDKPRRKVFTPMADILTPKTKINIGCWNVRTLCQMGSRNDNQQRKGVSLIIQKEGSNNILEWIAIHEGLPYMILFTMIVKASWRLPCYHQTRRLQNRLPLHALEYSQVWCPSHFNWCGEVIQ